MSSVSSPGVSSRPAALDDVAVLIPAYNGHDDLLRSLASLSEAARVRVN